MIRISWLGDSESGICEPTLKLIMYVAPSAVYKDGIIHSISVFE